MASVSNVTNLSQNRISIWASVNISMSIFGILLNILVLCLCIKNVRQNSYMWFIVSLSFADVCSAIQLVILSQPSSSLNDALCTMAPFLGVITVGAAITSHPLLALNRYVAIALKPIWYHRVFGNQFVMALLILLGWIIGGSFSGVDYAAGCLDRRVDADELACFFNPIPGRNQCVLPKIAHFFACYVIMGFCYCSIYVSLRRHQTQLASSGVVSSELDSDKQLLKLMALHALVPIFVHVPALIMTVVLPQYREKYNFLGYLTISLFVTEATLDAILTLFLVKIFRSMVAKQIKFLLAIFNKKSSNKVTPLVRNK